MSHFFRESVNRGSQNRQAPLKIDFLFKKNVLTNNNG